MYIKVKVITDAKREKFVKKTKDHFDISVKEPAERNMANKKVLELVRKYFKVHQNPARQSHSGGDKDVGLVYNKIRIVSGHHSSSKIISLNN